MATTGETTAEPRPLAPIRRFDVFAEVNRRKALAEGRPADEAKGYGIWLAKVVAGRRFGRVADDSARRHAERRDGGPPEQERPAEKFRHAGDELQTDQTFDEEIVERMGRDFYEHVFAPAIEAELARGRRYEQFRDTIRARFARRA